MRGCAQRKYQNNLMSAIATGILLIGQLSVHKLQTILNTLLCNGEVNVKLFELSTPIYTIAH